MVTLEKPLEGAPCNGCGLCCIEEVCALGRELGDTEVCRALEQAEDGSYRCGLVSDPYRYLPESRLVPWRRIDALASDRRLGEEGLKRTYRDLLGAGRGCDSRDDEAGGRMDIYFLVAQRKEDYHGQYAPEVLEALTEWEDEANPEFRPEKIEEYRAGKEFDRLVWVQAEVDDKAVETQCRAGNGLEFRAAPQPEGQLGIRLLMGIRADSYPGEHAPESLAVMDEYGIEINPEYLQEQAEEAQRGKEFEALGFIDVGLDMKSIRQRLYPENDAIPSSLLLPA